MDLKDLKQLIANNPSGFEDFKPGEAIVLSEMLDTIRKHYERAGYPPLVTPLVERERVLMAKTEGQVTKQVYGLRLLNPDPKAESDAKDLALRFDLTMPLARFVAKNFGELRFPLRRSAIGPVFRGERPRKGRYREFIQADIDVVGDGHLDFIHDAEMVAIIPGIFEELAIGPFTIRLNNRKIIQGLLARVGCDTQEKFKAACEAIDEVEKRGVDFAVTELERAGVDGKVARELLMRLLDESHTTDDTLAYLKTIEGDEHYRVGLAELELVIQNVRMFGVKEDQFTIDLSVVRGLDYYTSTVFETRLDSYPRLGSIASGGRYDDLVGRYLGKHMPGVGISIGVSRIVKRLIEANIVETKRSTVAPVLVAKAPKSNGLVKYCIEQAHLLRGADIGAEIYFADRDLNVQLRYADLRGFSVALLNHEGDDGSRAVRVRNLRARTEETVPIDQLVEKVRSML
ncbi:MAG TPA: histidine--tRNA ligase [Candidatus Paceibacterota bacterium]|nr:histidine--tRNA ligase [Candidatus Paceibacterota bacterium]